MQIPCGELAPWAIVSDPRWMDGGGQKGLISSLDSATAVLPIGASAITGVGLS